MDHAGDKFYHLCRRLQCRGQKRLAEGAEVGPEGDCLGDIDAAANASGSIDWKTSVQGSSYSSSMTLRTFSHGIAGAEVRSLPSFS